LGRREAAFMNLTELVLLLHEKVVALEKGQNSSNEDDKHEKPQD